MRRSALHRQTAYGADDNRINGEEALFVHFGGSTTLALFIRFTTQAVTTGVDGAPA